METITEDIELEKILDHISWSCYSSFLWDKGQWYQSYIKRIRTTSRELEFGKMVADSMSTDKPLAPFTRLSVIEHPLNEVFDGIKILGFIDTFEPKKNKKKKYIAGEFKTGKNPWTQKKAEEHGQLKMYSLLLWIQKKIRPEDIEWFLEWAPTQETGDFRIDFVYPIRIHRFEVRHTMVDILKFGSEVKKVYKQMLEYIIYRETHD